MKFGPFMFSEVFYWASQVAPVVKNLHVNAETQETWVWSLDWEAPLETETVTHFCILVWEILGTEEPAGL